jgi:tetratricopeptide (TPR) repeat protein
LVWADTATSATFGGDRAFIAWSTKAQILEKLNRTAEADSLMKKTMSFAGMNDIHYYGRQLLNQKKNKEALEIFKSNFQKYPNQFTTFMGLTRGYSANGDYKNALKYANMALPLAPDNNNKNNVTAMIQKLKEGKDVN